MTRRVGPSEQGQLQGALTSVSSITGIVGPSLFAMVFALFIGAQSPWHMPGAPFILAAALLATGAVLAWRITRPQAVTA
jgi:DHA1 family tetracycline resistance protein-like MFS transporter